MLKNINIRKATLAISAIWCLAVIHPSASAQSTDTGTLTVNGAVVTSTCLVNFRNSGTSGFNTSPVLELGSVKAADFLQTGAAPVTPVVVGSLAPVVVVTVSSPSSTSSACSLGGDGKWDLAITQGLAGGQTFPLNQFLASPSGTNALVRIRAAVVTDPTSNTFTFSNVVDISNTSNNIGTGGSTFTATATSGIAIEARFISTSPTVLPTVGTFNSNLVLKTTYN